MDAAPRCDDDFYCGQCEDCLTGEHPENRPRYAALDTAIREELPDQGGEP